MPTGHYQRKPRVERVVFICEQCGAEIKVTPGKARARKTIKYCSRKCMGLAMQQPDHYRNLNCEQCGKPFRRCIGHIHQHNFCSHKCAQAFKRVPNARWRDPQHIKNYMREYCRKPEQLEKRRQWVEENHEKVLVIKARYRESHREELRIKGQARSRTRLRRHADNPADLTLEQWLEILVQYGNVCLRCGISGDNVKLEIDHIVPISRGGAHTASNVQPLCRHCNAKKHTHTVDYRTRKREALDVAWRLVQTKMRVRG